MSFTQFFALGFFLGILILVAMIAGGVIASNRARKEKEEKERLDTEKMDEMRQNIKIIAEATKK